MLYRLYSQTENCETHASKPLLNIWSLFQVSRQMWALLYCIHNIIYNKSLELLFMYKQNPYFFPSTETQSDVCLALSRSSTVVWTFHCVSSCIWMCTWRTKTLIWFSETNLNECCRFKFGMSLTFIALAEKNIWLTDFFLYLLLFWLPCVIKRNKRKRTNKMSVILINITPWLKAVGCDCCSWILGNNICYND